jgi:hypothetical protein
MQKLTDIVTENQQQLGRQLQKHSLKPMDRESSKAMAVMISEMIDYYPEWGKDPATAKAAFKAFQEDLAGHSIEKINSAFKEWRRENKERPQTSDILKILNWEPMPKSSETRMFERLVKKQDREFERYHQLSPEKKAEHDKLMAELMARNAPEKKREAGEPNYKHWNMTPPDKQAEILQSAVQNASKKKI